MVPSGVFWGGRRVTLGHVSRETSYPKEVGPHRVAGKEVKPVWPDVHLSFVWSMNSNWSASGGSELITDTASL
jgi:hypothetical protein